LNTLLQNDPAAMVHFDYLTLDYGSRAFQGLLHQWNCSELSTMHAGKSACFQVDDLAGDLSERISGSKIWRIDPQHF
jgi:hypothetical protein